MNLEQLIEQDNIYKKMFPNLHSLLQTKGDDFLELRIKVSDRGGYMGIAKRIGFDGQNEVVFGGGDFPFLALASLEARVGGDGWKPEKPWKPKESAKK